MDCDKIKSLLDDFAEGELEAPQNRIVEEHLKTCPLCQKQLSAIRQVVRSLKEFREVDEPPGFLEQVRHRIESRRPRPFLSRLLPRPVPVRVLVSFSYIVLIGLGLWIAYRQFSPPAQRVASRPAEERWKPRRIARVYSRGRGVALEPAHETVAKAGKSLDAAERKVPAGAEGEPLRRADFFKGGVEREKQEPEAEMRERTTDLSGTRLAATIRDARGELASVFAVPPESAAGEEIAFSQKGLIEPAHAPIVQNAVKDFGAGRLAGKQQVASGPQAQQPPGASPEFLQAKVEPGKEVSSIEDKLKRSVSEGREIAAAHFDLGTPAKAVLTKPAESAKPAEAFEKAGDMLPLYDREKGAPSRDTKEQIAPPEQRRTRYADSNGTLLDLKEAPALEQTQYNFETWGRSFGMTGNLVVGYRVVPGPVPELVLTVKDRTKALAQITKAVADMGGTIHPAGQKEEEAALDLDGTEANVLVVTLKTSAYQSLFGGIAAPAQPSDLSTQKPESRDGAEGTQILSWQERPTTVRVRLIEVSQQIQPQPSPEK